MEARIRAELVALFEIDDQGPVFINNAFRTLFDEVKHVDPVSQDALSSAFYVVLGEAAIRVRSPESSIDGLWEVAIACAGGPFVCTYCCCGACECGVAYAHSSGNTK
jgi:hypothetical protein